MYEDSTTSDGSDRESADGATRRRFLKGTAAAGVAAAGVGTAATSASAQLFGGVSTISVSSGLAGWSADGSLPVTDELFIFIHGWFGDTTSSSQADQVMSSIEDNGFSFTDGAVLEWPATNLNYLGAEGDTENVGGVAAGLIEDFYDGGGGNVRLTGHSLGGRCVYEAMTQISGSYQIENVAGLGTAAPGSDICPGGRWNSGLDNACDVRNVHSGNDSTVGSAYGLLGGALGTDGSGCNPGSNYTDEDVTWSVSSHLGYLGNDEVGSRLASAFSSTNCGAGGTSGGTSGSSGGGLWGSGGSSGGSSGGLWGSGGSSDGSSGSSSGGGLWGSGGSSGGSGWF